MDHHAATTTAGDREPAAGHHPTGGRDRHGDGHAGCHRCVGRRTALLGMGAVGVAGLLAACGGDGPDGSSSPAATADDPGTDQATPGDEASTPDDTPDDLPETEGGGEALTTTGEVPVGSAVILQSAGVVVSQPADGTFTAFSATCTHQGCAVTEVDGDVITCTCHGSQFSATDGSVLQGPAEQPLPEVPIVVDGDQILAAG